MAYISVTGVVMCNLDVEGSATVRHAKRSIPCCLWDIAASGCIH